MFSVKNRTFFTTPVRAFDSYELAQAAQQYAFTKTNEFEKAFNKFVGIPTYNYEEKEKVSEVSETLN